MSNQTAKQHPKAAFERKRTLIEPRIQLRFSMLFLCIAWLSALVQVFVQAFMLQRLSGLTPNDGHIVLSEAPQQLAISFLLTVLLLTPVTLVIGVKTTFPIVGVVYRFKLYLREVLAGTASGPCVIRKTDDLHDLCDLLNEATAVHRPELAEDSGEAAPETVREPAA